VLWCITGSVFKINYNLFIKPISNLQKEGSNTCRTLEILGSEHEFSIIDEQLKALPIVDKVMKGFHDAIVNFVKQPDLTFGKRAQTRKELKILPTMLQKDGEPQLTTQSRRKNDSFKICAQCRLGCCQGVRPPLTSKRKAIIETYLREHKITLENLFDYAGYTFPREDKEGYCLFFDRKTKRCRIHEVKPETCVAGPITFDINTKTQKIEWHLKKETICALASGLFEDKQRLSKHLALAKREIRELVKELQAEDLKNILKIEEPETFKIEEDIVEKDILHKLI